MQILYNLAGEPAVTGTTPFTDLTQDWYQDAILWAYQTGVVAGTSATTFDPESPVTREQIAVILMGYADMVQHLKHVDAGRLSAFPDGASVSDWAQAAMADAVALELISGAGRTTASSCSRRAMPRASRSPRSCRASARRRSAGAEAAEDHRKKEKRT